MSSNPTTLFAAAKVLSKFRDTENGASRDVAAYLLRASESFDELVRLHRGLESSGSDRRGRKHRLSDVGSRVEDGPAAEAHTGGGEGGGEETEPGREKRRKRKRKEMKSDIATELGEVGQRIDGDKKRRKRKKSDEVEQEKENLK